LKPGCVKLLSLYWGYSLGGVGKYAVLLDSSKRFAPVEIRHLCIRGRDWLTDEQTLGLLGAHTLWIRSRADLSWIKALAGCIRAEQPDLIMTHGFNGHFVVQIMRLLGAYTGEVVCSYHGQYHATTRVREYIAPLFNTFTEWYIRRAMSTVAVAAYTKHYLEEKGVEPARIEVIHNGVPDIQPVLADRAGYRREWGIGDNDTVIGVASRLDPVKGIEYLLSAFARLVERHENIFLALVGTGTLEDDLRKQAISLGVDSRVRFIGFRQDVAGCLNAFDIFALPSLAEYHSIGLLEAMRAGKAIVSTDVGGNTESVRDEEEALVVPPADVERLETAMERLLTDERLRCKLSENARARFLDKFSEDVMLRNTGAWLSHCAKYILR